jgi:hypothetical protein
MTTDRDLTPLGRLLEEARDGLKIGQREAAARAGFSGGRWHQVVTGRQPKGGRLIAVNPRPRTVVAMALAVQVDPGEALRLAGMDLPADLDALVNDVRAELATKAQNAPATPTDLASEIERIGRLELPADDRLRIIRTVMALYEERVVGDEAESDAR